MDTIILDSKVLSDFKAWLKEGEKSENTVKKYLRDAKAFARFSAGSLTRETVISYKERLVSKGYAPRSVNSMLAAVNSLLVFLGLGKYRAKYVKCRRRIFRKAEKELTADEYRRLVLAAKKRGEERLALLIETVCATGIRIGELKYITVKAALEGEAVVSLKGKTRKVFIVKKLRKKLLRYARKQKVLSGPIFVTRSGRPICRSCVWRRMKSLRSRAGVNPSKVFPHNLRHLFAISFYRIDKDIAKLADVLGHSSILTTRIYISTAGSEHRRLMEKLKFVT